MTPCPSSGNGRYLSLYLPHWPTDRLKRRRDDARTAQAPVVLFEKINGTLRIAALDATAGAQGLQAGQALAEARAMHPTLFAAPFDAAGDASTHRRFAEQMLRYSPLVGAPATGEIFLDITGCAHLYGGEAALLADLEARLRRAGLCARAAIADSPGAAHALSHFGTTPIAAPGAARAVLAPLPVEALRLEEKAAVTLRRLGLKRIGQLYDLPRAPLTARFNAHLLRRLAQALGEEKEPIDPIAPASEFSTEARLVEPISTAEAIVHCVGELAPRLEAMLERAGQGGRRFELALFRVDNKVHRIDVRAARPQRKAAHLFKLFEHRLADSHDVREAGFGYDLVRLCAFEGGRIEAAPISAFGAQETGDGLADLVDRLSNRLGRAAVLAPRLENSHIPEKSAALVPVANAQNADEKNAGETDAYRPVKLLDRPEPIEATTLLPDAPPMRFFWRRISYAVKKASGPERIADEWWTRKERLPARDYYRVEDEDGRRWWIYREGLYGKDEAPKWFLHGFFG